MGPLYGGTLALRIARATQLPAGVPANEPLTVADVTRPERANVTFT